MNRRRVAADGFDRCDPPRVGRWRRDGRLVTRRAESKDPELKKRTAVDDDEADRLIRNTYKVLLTRGMRGTIIYATDPATHEYLASLVRPRRGPETRYESLAPGVWVTERAGG
jgi:hypothetical protein